MTAVSAPAIRTVAPGFADELAALCARSFAEAYGDVNSAADIAAYCEKHYARAAVAARLCNPEYTYQVAFRAQQAVGFFLLQNRRCPLPVDGPATELKQLYVLASEFGTGLGRGLLLEAARCGARAHKASLWLSVSDLNQRARSFYRKHGFVVRGVAPTLEVGEARLAATIMVGDIGRLLATSAAP